MTIALNNITYNTIFSIIHKTAKLFALVLMVCFHNLVLAQNWIQLSNFPGSKRDDGVAVCVNNKCYFGTGLQEGWSATIDFFELDLPTLSWKSIPDMPHTTERQYACAFAGPNSFYVFGGDGIGGALSTLYRYDVAARTWSLMASKPGQGLSGAACMVFGDSVVFVGGRNNLVHNTNNEVWLYQISNNTWHQKSDFPYGGRWRGCASVLHNKGYFMFGLDSNDAYRKELYRYQLSNDTWNKVGDFPSGIGRTYSSMVTGSEQLVLFAGQDTMRNYYKDIWYYNDINNVWVKDQNLPSFGRKGGLCASNGRNLYYSCGINSADQRLNETWMTDIPLGLKSQKKSDFDFEVFPNPCENSFFIQALPEHSKPATYRLLNTNGLELVASKLIDNVPTWIDIRFLETGLYMLELKIEGGSSVVKKIIKH